MVTKTRTTLTEYMAMPEEKPYRELLDGNVVEKCMGYLRQQTLVTEVIVRLLEFTKAQGLGPPGLYLSCSDETQEWVLIPACSYSNSTRMPWTPRDAPHPIPVLPELVVEVLGEGEHAGRMVRRISHYLAHGVQLLWVIDPDSELVTVWSPNGVPREYKAPDRISAAPVLQDFELDLQSLFDALRD